MIIKSTLIEEAKKTVTVKKDDGFYWVTVHKDGKLIFENRHLYEDTALAEADSFFYQSKLYHE
jgi:hypothetical protein